MQHSNFYKAAQMTPTCRVLTRRGQPFEQPTKNGLLTAEGCAIIRVGKESLPLSVTKILERVQMFSLT
jgi:hypothetical protein